MGVTYGQRELGTTGRQIQVIADLHDVKWKTGGITIDWATVTAVGADTVLDEGITLPNGKKFLRYGQIMCRIGIAEVGTLTLTGGPTAGAAIFQLPAVGTDMAENFTVNFDDTAAEVQATVNALGRIVRLGGPEAAVARSGAGTNGDPYIYSITWPDLLGNVPTILLVSHTFTGGTTPTGTPGTTTQGDASSGKYGPYDPAASDGRQTLARGKAFILNESVLEEGLPGFVNLWPTDHQAVLEGGRLFEARILKTAGSASLAAGPTHANFLTTFPEAKLVSTTY
jgi:hypothetical protein